MRPFLPLLLLLCAFTINGQSIDTTNVEGAPLLQKSSLIVLPILFYTPETRLGGGGAMLYNFRFRGESAASRPSQIQVGLAYTQENQILAYMPFQLFADEERWWIQGELGFYRYIYRFYGIGNEVPGSNEETYQATYPRVRFDVMREIQSDWYLGLRYWYDNYRIDMRDPEGLLTRQPIAGAGGNVVSALGLVSIYDTRDNLFFPRAGTFAQFSYLSNQPAFGSDLSFNRYALDVSQYVPFGKKVLALNAYTDLLFGNPPFQQLALIGGSKKMRGFFEGRYRDQKLWMLQAEYRFPVWNWLGATVFGGIGNVSPAVDELFAQRVHQTLGAGLRIRLSQEDPINLRIDVGFNEEGEWFPYLTVGEAF